MSFDALTVLAAATFSTLYKLHDGPMHGLREFWRGTLLHGRSMEMLLLLVCGFAFALIVTSRRMNLYAPLRMESILHEQRMSLQACFTSGLLLTGTLYLVKAEDISRTIVLSTIGAVTLVFCARRLVYRMMLYRQLEKGLGVRNVLIVGTGPEAQALRHHLESVKRLGYAFKGFIACDSRMHAGGFQEDVLGTLESLFLHTQKHFVDEIFFTSPCDRGAVKKALAQARLSGVDMRVVPEIYDGMALSNPVEYVGQFPTIPLHRECAPQGGMLVKRGLDLVFSSLVLLLLSPLLAVIALAIKLDSPGPVFYISPRMGKKGRRFGCLKFRTMVNDADKRLAEILHMNEREGALFKVSNDPRITRLGRLLRKYSLDELPQFINVLRGEMSVVGPRPPLASEVRTYKVDHLRRLSVMPGITGLWQVQGRQDPSFDSYVSLDVTYIENWSIWLDLWIVLRTVGVVLAGTGS